MAVETSISDMAWLTQPAEAGASFLRGAHAGSVVNENWRQNRELQMREMLAPLQRRAFQLQAENQALDIATKMRAEDDLTADKANYMGWAAKAASDPNLPIPAFRTSVYQKQALDLRKSSGDLMLNKIKTDQNLGFINTAQKLLEDGFGNELIIDYDEQGFLTPESRDSIQQAAASRRVEVGKKTTRLLELKAVLETATKGGRFAGRTDPRTGEFQGADYETLSESGADVAAIESAQAERLAALRYDTSRSDTALQKNLTLYNQLLASGDTEGAAIVMDAIRSPSLGRKASSEKTVLQERLKSIRAKREELAEDFSEEMTEDRRRAEKMRLDSLEAELIRRFSEGESLDIQEATKAVPGRPAPTPGTTAPSGRNFKFVPGTGAYERTQ